MSVQSHASSLNPQEKRAALGLAMVFASRMMGLFLVLPVFALYADQLQGSTPFKVGLAIGAYGLTQALLQIPFGVLSDRFGRKPVITAGLILFAIGSIVAAQADTIEQVIIGRFLQGGGAIAAAIMALAADLTREETRTRVMALIGMSIGMAFLLSLILGPILGAHFGVSGLFWITALLALVADLVVLFVVPTPVKSTVHRDAEAVPAMMGRVIRDRGLLRLDLGVFVLHMTLTAVFLVVPLHLRDSFALDAQHHWLVYLPVMIMAMGLMVPFIIMAERHRKMKVVMLGGITLLVVVLLLMGFLPMGLYSFAGVLVLFFAAFNVLEALMPSWVSKVADAELRGTAMGVFASSQFAGAFCGGLFGGWFHHHYGWVAVFLFAATMLLFWLVMAVGIQNPRHLGNFLLPLSGDELADIDATEKRLRSIVGVASVHILVEDAMAYLKVDNDRFDSELLQRTQQPNMPEPAKL